MKSLFVTLVALSIQSRADNSASVFTAAIIGGAVGSSYQAQMGALPADLADWSDPATQSTSRLEKQCGVLSEMKLVTTPTANYVFLGIRNEGTEDVSISLDRIWIKFQDGRERVALAPRGERTREVKRGWYVWGMVAIPKKGDFKGQSEVSVRVPVVQADEKVCEIESKFQRNPNVKEEPSSYIDAPNFIVSMGVGTLSAGGRLADMADLKRASLDVFLAGYRQPQHGTYLYISASGGDIKDHTAFTDPVYSKLSYTDVSIGYSHRIFYSDTTTGYLNIGPAYSILTASNPDGSEDQRIGTTKGYLSLYGSYTFEKTYLKEYFGPMKGQYCIGLTLFGKYIPGIQSASASRQDGTIIGLTFEFFRGGE